MGPGNTGGGAFCTLGIDWTGVDVYGATGGGCLIGMTPDGGLLCTVGAGTGTPEGSSGGGDFFGGLGFVTVPEPDWFVNQTGCVPLA